MATQEHTNQAVRITKTYPTDLSATLMRYVFAYTRNTKFSRYASGSQRFKDLSKKLLREETYVSVYSNKNYESR